MDKAKTGCEIKGCSDYKDGKCHYEGFITCKYRQGEEDVSELEAEIEALKETLRFINLAIDAEECCCDMKAIAGGAGPCFVCQIKTATQAKEKP